MFRVIIGFVAGFATAKLFTDSEPFEKAKSVIKRCSGVVKEEFGQKKGETGKEGDAEEKKET